MSTPRKDIVIDLWRAFSARDEDGIRRHLAADAVWRAPPGNATAKFLDAPSTMVGREQIVRFILDDFPRMFAQDRKAAYKGVYADGDTVVVEVTLSAILANGRSYCNDYCFIHQLKDGQVVEVRELTDTYSGHRMVFGEAAG